MKKAGDGCVRNQFEVYSGLPSSQDKKGNKIDYIASLSPGCFPEELIMLVSSRLPITD